MINMQTIVCFFLSGPLSLWERPFPCPHPNPSCRTIPQGQMGCKAGFIRARSVQFTAWKSQSLLSQKLGITFASPFSLPVTSQSQPFPSPGTQISLPLTVYVTLGWIWSSSGMVRHELWEAHCGYLWTLHSKGIILKAGRPLLNPGKKGWRCDDMAPDSFHKFWWAVTLPNINQEWGQW